VAGSSSLDCVHRLVGEPKRLGGGDTVVGQVCPDASSNVHIIAMDTVWFAKDDFNPMSELGQFVWRNLRGTDRELVAS